MARRVRSQRRNRLWAKTQRPAAPPSRRAARSAETRAKVIRAAAECLAEYGYAHATGTRIARRAGISWGGVQHHFRTKDAIIQAVLDRALDEFLEAAPRVAAPGAPLEERVRALVEGAWQLLNEPGFLAFFEVMLSHRRAPQAGPAARYRARVWKAILTVWNLLLGDVDLPAAEIETARRVAFTTLGGMVMERLMRTDAPDFDRPLRILQEHLLRLLRGAQP